MNNTGNKHAIGNKIAGSICNNRIRNKRKDDKNDENTFYY